MTNYLIRQQERRAELFAAHQRTLDAYWDDEGRFVWRNPKASGGYRAILWHCLSYLTGDAHCVEKANRIILTNYKSTPCHFTPGAAIDVLRHHRARLCPEAVEKLERYLVLNVPFMSTEDLKIHGYNDNHVYKAIHALIVGGEMLGRPEYVQTGLRKLRQAVEMFQRNGFPCEYNSPNYAPVSLNPLANIVEQAENAEARALALSLEHFYWQDLALHFDARMGHPSGPYSRGYVNDYSGLLGGITQLLTYLFPAYFDYDMIEEIFVKGEGNPYLDHSLGDVLPFLQAHPVWYASATYHLNTAIEEAIFHTPANAYVRGTAESGTSAIKWKPEDRPEGAPHTHHIGPRRSLLTTYYGEGFSLGTAQYGWLDNGQSHGFYALCSTGDKVRPEHVAPYYARMFYNDRSPYRESPEASSCFRDDGEIRTVQHENAAMVFYNPQPYYGTFKQLRTGVFRPLHFTRPTALYVGETSVPDLNFMSDRMEPICIHDGEVYLGIIPMRLTDRGQAHQGHLQVHTYADHLAILMSSLDSWSPRAFSYDDILSTNAGFVFEMHAARDFSSFAAFRAWIAAAQVDDAYYSDMRTTTYRRPGLTLSAAYSPFQSAFRYASVNNVALPTPTFSVAGMPDLGYGLTLAEAELGIEA